MVIKQIISNLHNELKTYYNEYSDYFIGYQDCLNEIQEKISEQEKYIKQNKKDQILSILNALENILPIKQLEAEGNDSLKAINDIRNILVK